MHSRFYYFEIALPKEFIKRTVPKWEEYDFKWKVTVHYSCNPKGEDITIDSIECGYTIIKFIEWGSVELERYLLDAALHNFDNQ